MLRTKLLFTMLLLFAINLPVVTLAAEHPLTGIPLRNIGPALVSGRVSDFAFHAGEPQRFYVSMASGGLWKTDTVIPAKAGTCINLSLTKGTVIPAKAGTSLIWHRTNSWRSPLSRG